MNRLSSEHSAYLKSAAGQPVHWFAWNQEAFEKARRENKPILLDIGAVWCHWCHVMDMESYEQESVAEIINEQFVAIKVDRDERPDIDARYQAAVSALTGQGGWPLTAFLMPDGRVFYGGTYFPPDDRYGRPGFSKVLSALSETFHKEHEKVVENAERLSKFVGEQLNRTTPPDDLSEVLLNTALDSISHSFDIRYGGFGAAPKFPHSTVIEFLLANYDRKGEDWMLNTVRSTLRAMAQGGIYDQLGGGFHRYSTDQRWIVPHFEKMLYDNAPLLVNYVHAYQAMGDKSFRETALGILGYVDSVLTDGNKGGFFASQDADVSFGDDGSYFTWGINDVKSVLDKEEFEVVQLHYDVYDPGEMQHDPSQNVLFVSKPIEEVASILKKLLEDVEKLLATGKKKLLLARQGRKSPFVDRTVYASWNGMMISAYVEAYKVFRKEESLLSRAERSMERILREHTREDGLISHRAVAFAKQAFLEDQVQIAQALLDLFEVTGRDAFLARAQKIMLQTIEAFWDTESGGFNDLPKSEAGLGALKFPYKSIQDSPTPAANSVAVLVLNRLFALTENQVFKEYAERTLRHFAGGAKDYGIHAASYFLALEQFLHPPLRVIVVANEGDQAGSAMHRRAFETYRYGKSVEKVSPERKSIPSAIKGIVSSTFPAAYVCTSLSCAPPVHDPDRLERTIKDFGRNFGKTMPA